MIDFELIDRYNSNSNIVILEKNLVFVENLENIKKLRENNNQNVTKTIIKKNDDNDKFFNVTKSLRETNIDLKSKSTQCMSNIIHEY